MGIEWQVVTVLVTLVSFIAIFVGCAWKFGSMITKLETLIENLSKTIDRIEDEQIKQAEKIEQRLDEHSERIRRVENSIIRLEGNNGKA